MMMNFPWRTVLSRIGGAAVLAAAMSSTAAAREPHIPGSGQLVKEVGDDFEDVNWKYNYNLPKSSVFNNKAQAAPGGGSANGRLVEAMYRGQPDLIKRVETPAGGIEGSKGALMLRTSQSGVPGQPSNTHQQDDLLVPFRSRIGRTVPVTCNPSCVVRVFLPPFEQWEQVSGSSFAFRADCRSRSIKAPGMSEEYWPGIFIQYEPARSGGSPSAHLIIRSDEYGRDFRGPDVKQLGWWTLGMSFTPDGMVHYYAHPGVEDLTKKDHIASHMPYGFRNEQVELFFFNVCSFDNGKSWSTPWVVDDARLYVEQMPTKSMPELNLPTRPTDHEPKDKTPERRPFRRFR